MIFDNIDMKNAIRTLRALTRDDIRAYASGTADDVLGRYGYQRRPSILGRVLPIAGAFGAGMAIGTGLGVLLAPKSGPETRTELTERINELTEKARAAVGMNGVDRSEASASGNGAAQA